MSNPTVLRARLARASALLGLVAAGAGGAGLLGRALALSEREDLLPSYTASLSILLLGAALALGRHQGIRASVAQVLGLLPVLLALFTFIAVSVPAVPFVDATLMAPITAVMVVLFSAGRLCMSGARTVAAGQALTVCGLIIALLALIGYVEGLEIAGWPFPVRMPVAASLALIALGLLFTRPDKGAMAIVTSDTAAGRVARRLVLPLMLLPLLLNFFFHHVAQRGLYLAPEWNNVLFVLSSMLIIASLAWWQILTLHTAEHRRRQFEDRVRQAQGQIDLIVQSVSDYAIYTIDPDGRISSWNSGAERIRGYKPEEIIGRPYEELFSPDLIEAGVPLDQLLRAARDGRVVEEGWQRRKDGTTFHAHSTLTRMEDGGGNLVGFTKVTRDITAQKQSEAEQIQLQTILDTVVDPILVIDSTGVIETFNRAAEQTFGYAAEEVLGQNVSRLMPTQEGDRHDDYLRHFGQTGEARLMGVGREIMARRKDGSQFPAELSVSEMRVGGELKYTGIVRDITARKAAEAALKHSEESLNLALEAGNIGVWRMNVATLNIEATGPLFEGLLVPPHARAEVPVWAQMNHPDDRERMLEQIDRTLTGRNELLELEHRLQTPDGEWRWLFTRANVSSRDEHGRPASLHGVTVDIHHRKLADEELRRSKLELELAIRGASFHLWHLHVREGRLVDLDQLIQALGYRDEPNTDRVSFWISLLHPDDQAEWKKQMQFPLPKTLSDEGMEVRVRAQDGSWRWMVVRARVTETDEHGTPTMVAGTSLDITERKRVAEQLLHAAQHDALTGLPNRALTYAFGERQLEAAPRQAARCAVLFVDLDRFKPINDQYGHATGDALLQTVAQRLKGCVRREDIVGRLGGDEFLIILSNVQRIKDISHIAANCLAAVSRPIYHRELELQVSPSIGISVYPTDGCDMDTLVKHADIAMYHAKQQGRNHFQFFTRAMNAHARTVLRLEGRMRRAISNESFLLHYQPIVDTTSQLTIGAEALLRWPAARIGPDEFIPLAESSGLILPLGDWVLHEACRQQKDWADRGVGPVKMSVNVSPIQFRQRQFCSRVARTINETGIDPGCLQLEITENAFLQNLEEVVDALKELRSMGVRIALDDFGKGYSSLNYLKSLPLDAVKVDKDFVHELQTDRTNLAITEAIIGLSDRLGLQVIAEGIETEEVLQLLRTKRCRHMQGFYFSHPLKADRFEAWCRESQNSTEAFRH